jgi:hypothetical protein
MRAMESKIVDDTLPMAAALEFLDAQYGANDEIFL